jgi:hypothetical protein
MSGQRARFHQERFKFRFLDLTEDSVARLQAFLPGTNLRVHIRGTGAVVTLLVTDTFDKDALYSFLNIEALDVKNYSIWVSVVSSSDHDGLALPTYVLDIIRHTQCGVDFSFVGCLDDPSERGGDLDLVQGIVPN